ncbi:MAG: PfkB family carbohydrate kinase [Bacteroidota bacterium]
MTADKTIDILSTGELLIDFISNEFVEDLSQVSQFKRLPGGSPANLCMNMARLGNRALLVACVGEDDMGRFLQSYCSDLGLPAEHIHRLEGIPTTLILVTRSQEVSNFEAYRSADACLEEQHFSDELLSTTRLFHTTCFAMSRQPAQSAIVSAAEKVHQYGGQLSVDANYAAKIWPNRAEAQRLLAHYCSMGALVKISEVDWERLYGQPLREAGEVLDHFLQLGAAEVCVTLGGDGCWVAREAERHFVEARAVEVKDTTGAGDAFWSGYLTAWLDGKSLKERAFAGRSLAELKLGHFGPLPNRVGRELLYE